MKLAWWRFSLPLLAFAGIAVFLALGLRNEDPRLVPSPFIGKAAPFFRLPELRDRARWVSSDDFEGKPFLLNVWASWCVACRDDHPGVTALAQPWLELEAQVSAVRAEATDGSYLVFIPADRLHASATVKRDRLGALGPSFATVDGTFRVAGYAWSQLSGSGNLAAVRARSASIVRPPRGSARRPPSSRR